MAVTAWEGETLKSGSGLLAVADYSGSTTQYQGPGGSAMFQAVTIGASGVTLVAAQGAGQIKVLTNKPKTGDPCRLVDQGETKMVAGGALTVGQLLMTDSSGRFVLYVDNGVNVPVGECRSPATTAGDIFTGYVWPEPPSGPNVITSTADGLTAHAGGGKASALALGYGYNRVTTVGTTADSVLAPPAIVGASFTLVNDAAANSLTIFGQGTDTIDGIATGTGNPMARPKRATFFCLTAGQWISNAGVAIA